MFSVKQKRHIATQLQNILKATNHPELPEGEITFTLYVQGEAAWSYADIKNNGAVETPSVNPHNEDQAQRTIDFGYTRQDGSERGCL